MNSKKHYLRSKSLDNNSSSRKKIESKHINGHEMLPLTYFPPNNDRTLIYRNRSRSNCFCPEYGTQPSKKSSDDFAFNSQLEISSIAGSEKIDWSTSSFSIHLASIWQSENVSNFSFHIPHVSQIICKSNKNQEKGNSSFENYPCAAQKKSIIKFISNNTNLIEKAKHVEKVEWIEYQGGQYIEQEINAVLTQDNSLFNDFFGEESSIQQDCILVDQPPATIIKRRQQKITGQMNSLYSKFNFCQFLPQFQLFHQQ